jgi:hypothetical protein
MEGVVPCVDALDKRPGLDSEDLNQMLELCNTKKLFPDLECKSEDSGYLLGLTELI